MPLPAEKSFDLYNRHANALGDPEEKFDEFALRRIRAEAIRELSHASDEGRGLLWVVISLVDDRLDRPEDALRGARNAVRFFPRNPVVLNHLGDLLGNGGDHRGALDAFTRACRLLDSFPEVRQAVWTNIAVAHHYLGESDAMHDALAEAMRATPADDVAAVLHMAGICGKVGEVEDAVELFARGILLRRREPRGDRPALDVIDAAMDDPVVAGAVHGSFGRCIAEVRQRRDAPVPEEFQTPALIKLPLGAWKRFVELSGL